MTANYRVPGPLIPDIAAISGISRAEIPTINGSNLANGHFSGSFRLHDSGRTPQLSYSDTTLRMVVYHPDSDFGPTDNPHPMINRTIIENVAGTGGNNACP
jgi:hypothetical protein